MRRLCVGVDAMLNNLSRPGVMFGAAAGILHSSHIASVVPKKRAGRHPARVKLNRMEELLSSRLLGNRSRSI